MQFHRNVTIVAVAFVHLIAASVIDKPGFDRPALLSATAIRQSTEADQHVHLSAAMQFVDRQSRKFDQLNENVAKNVILFMGDGMSVPVLAATRVYMGGEKEQLSFEKFPFLAMSKTYCVDEMVADSACSVTAYLTGVKGNYGTIGVNAKVPLNHCTAQLDEQTHTHSIAQWAAAQGKSIGLVTTTRVTHASPAGVYAHTAHRDWENNEDVRLSACDESQIDDIAKQLVYGETGSQLKVIFGGGRKNFHNSTTFDEEGNPGSRSDGRNLIQEWLHRGKEGAQRHYARNKAGLLSIKPNANDSYLGLFGTSHVEYNYKVNGISDEIPTLSEMTMKAIDILSQNPKGYFLFVEGGLIDHALHDTLAHIAIDETAEFSRAVDLARNIVNVSDSLIVVTADHAHTMTLSGYADRGSNIFGTGDRSDIDHMPYLKLTFANGPAVYKHRSNKTNTRVNPATMSDLMSFDFESPATTPRRSETHGGDDVVVYAIGPYSHLFTGSIEQNVIPHYMAYASCIGSGLTACDT